jgi:hypothetical protein
VQTAVDAGRTDRPVRNSGAPSNLTPMPEYPVAQYATAVRLAKGADACQRDARTANDVGDGYTTATVLLAIVLLLAGMSSRLGAARLRWTFLAASGLVLTSCTVWAATRPIASIEVSRDHWLSATCRTTVADTLAFPELE